MSIQLLLPLILLLLAFIIRIPIAIGMIISSVLYFIITGRDLGMVVEVMGQNIYTNYNVIAIPLFIFAANLMNTGTVTDRIFSFANALVGRLRGGLGHVNVLASLVFAGMSGSAYADASGLGKVEISAMRKQGYDSGFACAITAVSSTIGPVFPPSLVMVMYAMISGASIGSLFLGGVTTAVLMCTAMMTYIAYIARKRNYPYGVRYAFRDFLVYTIKATPALLMPIILLGGIYSGVMTPTEAAGAATLYTLLISVIAYRSIGAKQFWHVAVNTARTLGSLGFLLGSAFLLSYIVAIERIPAVIAELLLGFTDNRYVLLLLINIVFLILGMFLDTSVLLLVFTPIVLPLVKSLGIDLVHFGVMLVINMEIGLITPPYGMLLFIISGVSGTKLQEIIKETIPMLVIMLIVLVLITYIPEIVLFLPNLAR